ncbi:hypothetical protein PoB_004116800 [Plakobranchus ocellatus]|uniref:Uncharacterized protein n=1 Tax=Plakobranchus ocellatus TaxID=259542 RepID=A0AAV4B4Z7_9GAST|nr:hypothetical protein PoB_004116800 [Plakobranchus ocellatus]
MGTRKSLVTVSCRTSVVVVAAPTITDLQGLSPLPRANDDISDGVKDARRLHLFAQFASSSTLAKPRRVFSLTNTARCARAGIHELFADDQIPQVLVGLLGFRQSDPLFRNVLILTINI